MARQSSELEVEPGKRQTDNFMMPLSPSREGNGGNKKRMLHYGAQIIYQKEIVLTTGDGRNSNVAEEDTVTASRENSDTSYSLQSSPD